MLRAVGFGDGDFEKPIVGVANGHSTMNPCNAGIQPLVDRAMAALEKAGAKPQVFGVPTVTDGIGMGTEAMKYSLVSREVIADAIETSVTGQAMDGALVVGACLPGGSTPVPSPVATTPVVPVIVTVFFTVFRLVRDIAHLRRTLRRISIGGRQE